MRPSGRTTSPLGVLLGLAVVAVACGDDDGDAGSEAVRSDVGFDTT